ncbi:unnamed protein product [Peniophora sp. CBMAI 1063]|nr:unnamed protein product [Peniophora sp. CBMAI 1063]
MEWYASQETKDRAYEEAYLYEWLPPPDAYQLPPYQATVDAFLVRCTLLSPPPIQLRAYGMPEYLWSRLYDWIDAPVTARRLVAEKSAVGFRMRWPRAPVVIRTRAQEVWMRNRAFEPPSNMVDRIEALFFQWEAELHAQAAAFHAPTAAPPVFYRLKSEYIEDRANGLDLLSAAVPFDTPAPSHSGGSQPLDPPVNDFIGDFDFFSAAASFDSATQLDQPPPANTPQPTIDASSWSDTISAACSPAEGMPRAAPSWQFSASLREYARVGAS